MSKLFEKLKGAAREREGGLLLDALASKKAVEPAPLPAPPAPSSSHTPLAGIAVALAIFGLVMVAWHSTTWRLPPKTRIDATSLKLDRSLDVNRTDGAARSSRRDRDPSR